MENKSKNYFKLYLWSLSFLKKYSMIVIIYLILIAMHELSYIFLPKIIQQFIDIVVINKEISILPKLISYTVVLVVVIIFSYLLSKMCELVFVEKGTKVIQYKVIDKMRELGYEFFERVPRGELLAKTFKNVLSVHYIYVNYIPFTYRSLFGFVFPFVMILLSKNTLFISFSILSYIGIVIAALISSKLIHNINIQLRDYRNLHYKKVYNCMETVTEIKGYNSEEWISNGVFSELNKFNNEQIKAFVLENKVANYVNVLQAIAVGSYFIFGLKIKGNIFLSVGSIVAYYAFIYMSTRALSTFMKMLITQNRELIYAEQPYEFMHLEPKVKECLNATNNKIIGSIAFNNVSYNYPNKESILKNITTKIKAGDKVCIVGASGCGKTTILKLLLRSYDCINGEICLDGEPIQNYSFSDLRDSIGIVFQEMFLYSDTVLENLKFAKPNATDQEIFNAAKLADAHEFIKKLPDGYNTLLGSRGESLSGGQRQRLSIARIILKSPDIYLLDEITSDLDYITENIVISNLLDYSGGKTLLIISHRLSVIKKFKRILVVHQGRIVEDGNFDTLFEKGTYFHKLVGEGVVIND